MKKITLVLILCSLFSGVKAAVIIDETFNYSATNLSGEAAWTTTGTLTTGTGRNIESGGLSYSNAGGTYIHSGVGKKINHDYSNGTNYFAYKSFTALTTGTVYLSFLYKANGDQGQTASEVLGLSYANNASAVKLWAGKQANGTKNPFRIGITRSSTSSGDIQWSSTLLNTSDTYLIVIKYDLTTYTASLFVNPVLNSVSEPTPDAIAATDGSARTTIGYLIFKHSGSSVAKFFVSGVRISTLWSEAIVNTAPQLTSPVIGVASNFTANGFNANWSSVTNSTGYAVKLFANGNLISTNDVALGTTTLAFTSLNAGTNYSYIVIAKGDGINYSNSSSQSTNISISTPLLLAPFDIRPTGFKAYWKTTTNSTGYVVKVYQDGDLISTTNVSGQSSTSCILTGLHEGLNYTYTVTGSDGYSSLESAPITTLIPTILETFSDWNAQTSVGAYSITKNLYDGVTSGTFSSDSLVVSPSQSIGSVGVASGNGRPSVGRFLITYMTNYIQLPFISNISTITCKNHAGTVGSGYKIQSSTDGINWSDVANGSISLKESVTEAVTFNINSSTTTYIRMIPLQNAGVYFWDLQVNPYISQTKLETPIIQSASDLSANSFTANWETVENALGYYIKVYQNGNYISTTYVDGQSSTTGLVSGLNSNTYYTYKVIAKGNVTNYASSDASLNSTSFKTAYDYTISGNTNISTLESLDGNSSILVATGNTLTINSNTTVNSITVAPGAKVTLADTKTLTGTLTLQSDAGGTATFVDENPTGATVSGTIQQHLTSGRNWYMSIPINTANTSNFSTAGSVAGYYEPTGLWYTQTLDSVLNPMRGYISVATASTGTVSFAGTLNTGEKFIDLKRTSTAAKPGFNLVGNPYPSYVSWEAATKTNLEPTIWYRSRNAGNTAYIFDTYNATTHIGTGLNGSNVTTYIPPMQAFWVRVSVGNTTGRLTLDNTMRSHASGTNKLKAPAVVDQQVVRLKVSNGVNEDEAILVFNANASNGFDGYDSQKQSNTNKAIPEIYTLAGNEEVVINGLNSIPSSSDVALGFRTGELNNFSIKASEISNFDNATRIVLKDNTLNKEIDLTDGAVYNFSSDVTNSNSRFSLLFKVPTTVTAIDSSSSQNNALVCVNAGNHLIINNAIGSNAALYNSVGQLIENKELASNSATLNTKLSAGIYFVKINFGNIVSQYKIRIN